MIPGQVILTLADVDIIDMALVNHIAAGGDKEMAWFKAANDASDKINALREALLFEEKK